MLFSGLPQRETIAGAKELIEHFTQIQNYEMFILNLTVYQLGVLKISFILTNLVSSLNFNIGLVFLLLRASNIISSKN